MKLNEIKILFFGSNNCEKCNLLKELLDDGKLSYKFININDEKVQDFCDIHGIYKIPRVKVIIKNKIILDEIGLFDIKIIKDLINEHMSK